jgi:hypothetical protein
MLKVTVRADGSWNVSGVIGDNSDVGAVQAFALCNSGTRRPPSAYFFSYRALTLHISTYRRLVVSPDTAVKPGTMLTIRATPGCRVPGGGGSFIATLAAPSPSRWEGWTDLEHDATGGWVGEVLVPANASSGSYRLFVECGEPRSFYGFWPELSVNVT